MRGICTRITLIRNVEPRALVGSGVILVDLGVNDWCL